MDEVIGIADDDVALGQKLLQVAEGRIGWDRPGTSHLIRFLVGKQEQRLPVSLSFSSQGLASFWFRAMFLVSGGKSGMIVQPDER